VIRSKWNEASLPTRAIQAHSHQISQLQAEHSLIHQIAEQKRQFAFSQLTEARKTSTSLTIHMLLLILAESIMLSALVLTPGHMFGGSSLISLLIRLAFVLGAAGASLLLIASMAWTVYGTSLLWRANLGSTFPVEPITRQKLLLQALEELTRLRQVHKRANLLYHRASLLFLIALLPYLLALTVLILQVL